MRRCFFILAAILLSAPFVSSDTMAQDASVAVANQATEHSADVLVPPPLPKLDKGEWKSEKTVFHDALNIEDDKENPLDKTLDLPGTKYSAHLDYQWHIDVPDEDLMNVIASNYEKALEDKYFEYSMKVPGYPAILAGVSADGPQGGVHGQSVIAQGKLRFVAVSTNEPDAAGDDQTDTPPPKDIKVAGDIEIFVSDEIPVADLIQMISAKQKAASSGVKP